MFSGKHLYGVLPVLLLAVFLLSAEYALYGPRGGAVSFGHGVASGDPLADRVILWTRVTPLESQKRIRVRVEVASDEEFENLVHGSVAAATGKSDYTVKVDVGRLSAGTVYYYRFRSGDAVSATGRTRTLPRGDVENVRLAVFSCAKYPVSTGGYFNVYGHAARTADVDAVLHLGDYIYEYGSDPDAAPGGRDFPAAGGGETLTLKDYRRRYALYRTDPQLQALHAAHPFIAVWDDHEVANDAWDGGAENHGEDEGSFEARREAAHRAYYEWMPVRPPVSDASGRIYRRFSFGNLVELFMLDTRFAGRQRQLRYRDYFDPETGFDARRFREDIGSADRTLLGRDQLSWLRLEMTGSAAAWQVLGQQVLMGRMTVPAEVIRHLDVRTPAVAELIGRLTEIKARVLRGDGSLSRAERERIGAVLPYNLDAWDGYPAEREAVLAAAYGADKNLVVLSGDTHNAWANDLRDAEGRQVGVEFAGPAVSSGGLETYLQLSPKQAERFARDLETLIDGLAYSNAKDRGYMIVSFYPDRVRSRWIYVDTVKKPEFRELSSSGKTLGALAGKGNRRIVSD